MLKLNQSNYFSPRAMAEYVSCSQLKDFIGTPFKQGCEQRAMANLRGEFQNEVTKALLLGTYVDTMLTGSEEEIVELLNNPDLISSRGTTKGQLKAEFMRGNTMVESCKSDPIFMKYINGEHQVIMSGEIEGVPVKIKVDSLLPGKAIVDLKTCESITKRYYSEVEGKYISFIKYHNYVMQGAIYQEIVRQNTGEKLPFFLACVSSENVPDKAIIWIDDDSLAEELERIKPYIVNVNAIKKGELEPTCCGKCDYCKSVKKIEKAVNWLELDGEF